MKDKVEEKGKWHWPYGVCKKGVGNNSILCHGCKKWIHKRCSGVKEDCVMQANRSSADAVRQIVQSQMGLNTDLHLDIGNGISLEKVDKFGYLG